jgi:hypothetical protein
VARSSQTDLGLAQGHRGTQAGWQRAGGRWPGQVYRGRLVGLSLESRGKPVRLWPGCHPILHSEKRPSAPHFRDWEVKSGLWQTKPRSSGPHQASFLSGVVLQANTVPDISLEQGPCPWAWWHLSCPCGYPGRPPPTACAANFSSRFPVTFTL